MLLARWGVVTHTSESATAPVPPPDPPATGTGTGTEPGTEPEFEFEFDSEPEEAAGARAAWPAVRASAFAGGMSAAGLGLGAVITVVLLLWMSSPFPENGLGGALHIGAGLWLLAQGAELVRTGTLSGDPAPVAVTPLLLSALPAWLLYRGTASVVTEADPEDPREAALVAGWVLGGYLVVAAVVVGWAAGGSLRVNVLTALYVLLFAAFAAGAGAWKGCGRPAFFGAVGEEIGAALRAAGIAGGVLLAGGALLGAVSLAWHAGASGRTYAQLSGPLVGRFAVLLLAVALVPNLAVWAASYGLGVGFSVGVGSAVGPAGASGYGLLPAFPLLAALPRPGAGGWVGWVTLVVPVAAGGVMGWWAGGRGWAVWRTVRVVAGAGVVCGCGFAVLAAWSGGALGTGTLARFGPTWWLAGPAALAWIVAVALPTSLLTRVAPRCRPLWNAALRFLPHA